MSGGLSVLALKNEDVRLFLVAKTHVGTQQLDFQMQHYCFKRRGDGVYLLHLRKTWEKLLLAARAIVAIENPADVCAISSRPYGQRAVLKFASFTGATPIAGRFTPGTFTNQIQAAFREPRLLVVCDPREDHQPVTEASYVNIPVVAFCNTDACLRYVDIAIPCNNKGQHSIGLMWWMLTREVLRMRGSIVRDVPWGTMVDLFFYSEPEEAEKEEQVQLAPEKSIKEAQKPASDQWGAGEGAVAQPEVVDWSATPGLTDFSSVPAQQTSVTDEWSAAASTAPAQTGWGAGTDDTWV